MFKIFSTYICCILYIYSTNIGTEYFKHGTHSTFFFSLQNAVCFIILTYLVPVLFTFYIQDLLKLKKNNSGAKRLIRSCLLYRVTGLGSFIVLPGHRATAAPLRDPTKRDTPHCITVITQAYTI